jgi:glycerol-3-phosphate dehydrogenase subunit C
VTAIDPNPKRPPAYDPTDDRYWDPVDLDQEIHRIFDICHSCRMCLSYCPSFPDLFARVDGYIGRGVAKGAEKLDAADLRSVVDNCYQCKLCYIKCPYTEDEEHKWLVDYPKIALREKAQRARRDGVTLQDQILGEPQFLGEMTAGPQAHIANFVNSTSLVRKVAEKTVGISAKFPLPTFATEPFARWWSKHEATTNGEAGEVAIFPTCYAEYNTTGPAIAAVQVLEAHGYAVFYPKGMTCCGMPNLDGGDVPRAQEKARQNIDALLEHVRAGRKIVVPGPTCSYTLTKEYPGLVGTDEAREVAAACIDLMKFVDVELRRKKKLKKDVKKPLGKVAIQAPCHLRAQKIAFPSVQILEALGAEVELVQECSAVDGTWGMKAQYYEQGRRYAQKLIRGMRESEADLFLTDCPLSALRISHETGKRCVHPIEAIAEALGLGAPAVPSGSHISPEDR